MDNSTHELSLSPDINPWVLWTIFFSSILLFVSLWLVSIPVWHYGVSLITLILLWRGSPYPLKTLTYILGLVAFLAVMQIVFSPFMRALFMKSLKEGFLWSDWQYLLFAVERFALPLVIVSTFQSRLANPTIIAHLTALLSPLKWVGFKIDKLQVLVSLALKFLPSLKLEWERFSHFQTYFVSSLPQRTLIQRINYWQGVFRAMIGHTIYRAVSTGEVLALRGLPDQSIDLKGHAFVLPLLTWLSIGTIFFFQDARLVMTWGVMSIWMLLTVISSNNRSTV